MASTFVLVTSIQAAAVHDEKTVINWPASTQLTLIWSDEFNKAGNPDPSKWGYELGFVRNGEQQFYTKRPENIRIHDGCLEIAARKEVYDKAAYTSASLTTSDTFTFAYGRVEVKAKIPTGRGLWPAIWMLGSNFKKVGWPACGEIDIMENVGFDPEKMFSTVHATGGAKGSGNVTLSQPWAAFHLYILDWYPDRLEFRVDDLPVLTYQNDGTGTKNWPFDGQQHLIINVAIGGGWGGQQGIDDAVFPQTMQVDYVRVYELPKISTKTSHNKK